WNFFDPSRRRWHVRCCIFGWGIGLPLEVLNTSSYFMSGFSMSWLSVGTELIHQLSSMLLALGYAGTICLLVIGRRPNPLSRAVASVGRTALSNYLLQTILATTLCYWWGFGLFGELSRAQQLVVVAAIIVGQTILSVLWLRVFIIGPLEWLWRTLTYGRLQVMVRRRG
ncbi:MAG: DUF418 domain-containing protein, partial [Planctomycetota bacterium]|nr:DUF418 domain-containing protein [Planctomycetota bacterium]